MKSIRKLALSISLLIGNSIYSYAQTNLLPNYRPFTNLSRFKIDTIIDARYDKDYLGLIIDEKSKSIDTLKSQENYCILLQNMFNSCIGKEQKQPVILKLNHVEFGKRQVETKIRYWTFYDFELYLKNSDGTFSTVFNGVQAMEGVPNWGEDGFNEDFLFAKLHWYFWNDFIDKIPNSVLKNIAKQPQKLTLSDISKPLDCPPIFCDNTLNTGSYLTKKDFLNNQTKIKEYNIQKNNIQYTDSTDNSIRTLPSTYIYGYSDGKQLYINYNMTNQYVPVERLGTVFEASGLAPKAYTNNIHLKNQMALKTFNALAFPSGLNTGLAVVSAVSLMVNLLKDAENYRLVFDTRSQGEAKKMVFVVLK